MSPVNERMSPPGCVATGQACCPPSVASSFFNFEIALRHAEVIVTLFSSLINLQEQNEFYTGILIMSNID